MKLRLAPGSPTGMRVLVTAREAGISERLRILPTPEPEPTADLEHDMPLGHVPELECDDGRRVAGSRAICAYLDSLHEPPKLMPTQGEARLELYQLETYADELLDAAVALEREARRPSGLRWEAEAERHRRKAAQVLDRFEAVTDSVMVGPVTLGHIAVACTLAWIDRSLTEVAWREGHPALAEWYARFSGRQSMQGIA